MAFLVPVDPAEAVLSATRRTVVARRPLNILVAEDNPVNRIVVGAILGEFGHRAVFSGDGRAAVESLGREPYDLILMDIEMPDLDGPSALAAIRALAGPASRTPVVALSARGEEARHEALSRGFDDYVAKPIDPEALFRAIEATTMLGGATVGEP
jgi:CheY-like chemotaxis protein